MVPPSNEFPKNPQRLRPYSNFRFKVKWADGTGKMVYVAGISRVSDLSRSTEVIEHREGGDPSVIHLAPDQTEYSPITLERGVSYDPEFETWANKVFDYSNSQSQTGQNTLLGDFRKDLILEVFNEAGQRVLAYNIYRAWVSEYSAISELDANGSPALVLQSLTVQNEGWERDSSVAAEAEPNFGVPDS